LNTGSPTLPKEKIPNLSNLTPRLLVIWTFISVPTACQTRITASSETLPLNDANTCSLSWCVEMSINSAILSKKYKVKKVQLSKWTQAAFLSLNYSTRPQLPFKTVVFIGI
jgi:hypothetical protein